MRLYLSSFDLGHYPQALVALTGTARRAAIVVNALDDHNEDRANWLASQMHQLGKLGFTAVELDLRDYFARPDQLGPVLDQLDLVWVSGGNTFVLRRAMKQSGFDELIKQRLASDQIVYGGFSAGAVIAAPGLRGLETVDNPVLVPPGYDPEMIWDGLGLVPFAIVAHFLANPPVSEAVDRTIAFLVQNAIPYRTLRDGEALVIDGDHYKIAGFRSDGG